MSEEFHWFVGVDWAREQHCVCLLDATGEQVAERNVTHDGTSLAELCSWLLKTTTAANVALALAFDSARVLLIDADLRRPSVHGFFGVANSSGLVNYLTGNQDWRSAVYRPGPAGLDVLLCGPVPPNPADFRSRYRRSPGRVCCPSKSVTL